MKLNNNLDLSILKEYGFREIDKESAKANDDYALPYYEYEFDLGYGRRGQWYSLLVDKNGEFSVYASDPDGSGAPTLLSSPIFFRLIEDSIVMP